MPRPKTQSTVGRNQTESVVVEFKPLSSWDRRKQYMENIYRRRRMSVHTKAAKCKTDDSISNGSTAISLTAAQTAEKENITGPQKPKRLRRSASYTILPSSSTASSTSVVEPKNITDNSKNVDKKSVIRHLPLIDSTLPNESPITRQNTFTCDEEKPDGLKVTEKKFSPEKAKTTVEAVPKESKQGKQPKGRVISSRYMKGLSHVKSPFSKVETANKRATLSSLPLRNTQISDNTRRATLLAEKATKMSGKQHASFCNPRPTKTSLLRQKMIFPSPLSIKPDNLPLKQRNKTTTPKISRKSCKLTKIGGQNKNPHVNSSQGGSTGLPVDSLPVITTSHHCQNPDNTEGNMTDTKTPLRKKSVQFTIHSGGLTPSNVTLRKTPKKNLTLRERFDVWFCSQDVSPSKYRHLRCFGLQLSELRKQRSQQCTTTELQIQRGKKKNTDVSLAGKENVQDFGVAAKLGMLVDKASILNCIDIEVRNVLPELKQMLSEGYSPKDVRDWLEELRCCMPSIEQEAAYWECKALAAKNMGNLDEAVDVFNEAVERGIEPEEQLANSLAALLIRTEIAGANSQTHILPYSPKQSSSINDSNLITSSIVRYSVDKTPKLFKKISKAMELASPEYLTTVVTPVRRSKRLIKAKSRNEAECIDSLDDLPVEVRRKTFLRRNSALEQL